jgi:hypothetical protein
MLEQLCRATTVLTAVESTARSRSRSRPVLDHCALRRKRRRAQRREVAEGDIDQPMLRAVAPTTRCRPSEGPIPVAKSLSRLLTGEAVRGLVAGEAVQHPGADSGVLIRDS